MKRNYNIQRGVYADKQKEPKELKADESEFKRVKYSLKMALRMINGSF